MARIGVALAVPEPWGTQLQSFRTSVGDSGAAGIPTHITLVPPTDVGDAEVARVEQQLATAAGVVEPFVVHLRGTGTFRPVSPVVFVSLVEGISQCEQLADLCQSGLLDAAPAFPYHPHVTVAHHVTEDCLDRAFLQLTDFECVFEVDCFHLYVHDEARGWRATRDFTLRHG